MSSPPKSTSKARPLPMRRGNRAMGPPPGTRPAPTSNCDRIAFSRLAKRMSQASAISLPLPVARPRIKAIDTTDARVSRTRISGQACKPVGPAGRPVRSSSFPRKSEWFRKKPSTALSKTTTLTCLSVSSVVMISVISRIPSGPKTLSGGWSNVTRQYAGERRDSRISLTFVADEFWFFIFSSRSFVRRAHIGKLGKQIAVRSHLVLRYLPVCENSHEDVTGVVGERPAIAREGCWEGGVIGHHIGQQCLRRSLGPLGRVPANMLERVCEDGNEAAIVRRLT